MSSAFSIEPIAADQSFRVSGELTLSTAKQVLAASESLFSSAAQLNIDLQSVTRADSAGLALLVAWMRLAKQKNIPIRYDNIPNQMIAIAAASGLDDILPQT